MAKSLRQQQSERMSVLMQHYTRGTQDMDIRRTRKNGWNEIINAYMGKLPTNWPFLSVVTDPVIRTTILEKTARLLNSKLQGRLVPREEADTIKTRINNAILDYQWDNATIGGPMVEKVAGNDQLARIFGASFAFTYWDTKKDCNEIKVIDPRDIFFDPSATHIRNAKWVQVREFTTVDALERRGYDVKSLKSKIDKGEFANDMRSSAYEVQELLNRQLVDELGNDIAYHTLEVVTEWTPTKCTVFLPRHDIIIKDGNNPYEHQQIPVAQLRYYPLLDDIYGDSEVEPVIPLQRAINAFLCGTVDELNLAIRPPVVLLSNQYRAGTIEYGPGAHWIVNRPDAARELQMGSNAINAFNTIYPALKAAFNTAMGDQSLGISSLSGKMGAKTATEVVSLERQQTNRDQYNQLYLAEFLKDIMMMWLSNNKQYLFDDPRKSYRVLKIIGKQNVQVLQALKLDGKDIPDEVMESMSQLATQYPEGVDDAGMSQMLADTAVPTHPVILNPEEENPSNYDIKPKLDVKSKDEADLYYTKEDLGGVYDYIPDVKSMAAGAGIMQQQARDNFIDKILNPTTLQLLAQQGESVNIKEILVNDAEDAGWKDAESLFQPTGANGQPTGAGPAGLPTGANPNAGGETALGAGQVLAGDDGMQGLQGLLPPEDAGAGIGGLPEAELAGATL